MPLSRVVEKQDAMCMIRSCVYKTGRKVTDMSCKHVCMSVHTCLHMISEHLKGVEGCTQG